jgi:signal recognition particle subunit SRP54
VGLAREAQLLMDQEEQEKLRKQMEKGQMTLEDFRNHIQKIAKPGLLQKMIMMMPGIPAEARDMLKQITGSAEGAKAIKRQVGMIDSMTPEERRQPKIIDSARKQRIAKGSGAAPNEITELVKQFESMKGMMSMMAGGDVSQQRDAIAAMQQQMLNPAARMPSAKGSSGKRLTPKEREKMRKEREKALKRKKRGD